MKKLSLICALVCWVLPVLAATNEIVTVKLKNGTQFEGLVLAESPEEVTLQVSYSGGTISKKETYPRTEIVSMEPVSQEELARREEETMYQLARRYVLNPQVSYQAAYYEDVVNKVFRAFLTKFPNSSHTAEVAQQLGEWEAEQRLVKSGQVKYKGNWMSAADAQELIDQVKEAQLLAEAETLAGQRRYYQAVEKVRTLKSPAVKEFLAKTYEAWLKELTAEEQALPAKIDQAKQAMASAQQTINQFDAANAQVPGGGIRGGRKGVSHGASASQLAARNQASTRLASASQELARLQARANTVTRELDVARAGAGEFGITISPEGTVASAPSAGGGVSGGSTAQDLQSGRVTRGESKNPELLSQIADFFSEYWMVATLIVLVAIWYFSRKMSR